MHKRQVIPIEDKNEQWSRKAWPVRQNYNKKNYSEEFDPGSG